MHNPGSESGKVWLPISSAYRWINCPQSVRHKTSGGNGEWNGETTAEAREGIKAHSLAHAALQCMTKAINKDEFNDRMREIRPTKEMFEAVKIYSDAVREECGRAGAGAVLMAEEAVNVHKYVPFCRGKADAVIISADEITVIDFKYGEGELVEVEENPQLMLYALGAAIKYQIDDDDDKNVKIRIIQPRKDYDKAQQMRLSKIKKWAEEIVRPSAEKVRSGKGDMCCGKWCQYCPQYETCRQKFNQLDRITVLADKSYDELTNEEIIYAIEHKSEVIKWLNKLEERVLDELEKGKGPEGLEIVPGRIDKVIGDKEGAAEALLEAGYTEAQIYKTRDLKSKTQLKKILNQQDKDLLTPFCTTVRRRSNVIKK